MLLKKKLFIDKVQIKNFQFQLLNNNEILYVAQFETW